MLKKGFQAHGDQIYHCTFEPDRKLGKICIHRSLFQKKKIFISNFKVVFHNFFQILGFFSEYQKKIFGFLEFFCGISEKILLLKGKLRLRACLTMCLFFQENRGWRAYKRVAYKKSVFHSILFIRLSFRVRPSF